MVSPPLVDETRWRVLVANVLTGKVVGEVVPFDISWDESWNEPGGFSLTISIDEAPDRLPVTMLPEPITHVVAFVRGETVHFVGQVWARSFDLEGGTCTVDGAGLLHYADRQIVDADRHYESEDQGVILSALLIKAFEPLPWVTVDFLANTGVRRDLSLLYSEFGTFWEAISGLLEVENAPQVLLEHSLAGDQLSATVELIYPEGRVMPFRFDQGVRGVNIDSWDDDASMVANRSAVVGASTAAYQMVSEVVNPSPYPPLWHTAVHADARSPQMLEDSARYEMAGRTKPAVQCSVTVPLSTDFDIGSVRPGDMVQVGWSRGVVTADQQVKIMSLSYSVAGVNELVSLECVGGALGMRRADLATDLARISKSVRQSRLVQTFLEAGQGFREIHDGKVDWAPDFAPDLDEFTGMVETKRLEMHSNGANMERRTVIDEAAVITAPHLVVPPFRVRTEALSWPTPSPWMAIQITAWVGGGVPYILYRDRPDMQGIGTQYLQHRNGWWPTTEYRGVIPLLKIIGWSQYQKEVRFTVEVIIGSSPVIQAIQYHWGVAGDVAIGPENRDPGRTPYFSYIESAERGDYTYPFRRDV